MKLSKVFAITAIGAGTIGIASYIAACGGSSGGTPAPTSTGAGALPPPVPTTGTTPASSDTVTFAVQQLFLGDTDRMGVTSTTAWKGYGYNLDGKITTGTSTDVCTRAPNAGASSQIDGTNGIDNAFGSIVLPIIAGELADPSATVNKSIANGSFTVMLQITGLTSDPKQTSTGLVGSVYAGSAYDPDGGTTPTFMPTTDWPVSSSLLADGTLAGGSKVKFPMAYISNGTFVNGSPATITLSLTFAGVALSIEIDEGLVTFDHTAPGAATNGTIAGVIDTEGLINNLQKVAGNISPSLCKGTTFNEIADTIRKASDMIKGGTNMAGPACDAISIGIGFSAAQIANPTRVAAPSAAAPNACADAGTTPVDAGTTDSGDGG